MFLNFDTVLKDSDKNKYGGNLKKLERKLEELQDQITEIQESKTGDKIVVKQIETTLPEMDYKNSQESFQSWLNSHIINEVKYNLLPSRTLKQLNRDWKRFQEVFWMSEWYELSAVQEVNKSMTNKWVKYRDEPESDDENADPKEKKPHNPTKSFEMF